MDIPHKPSQVAVAKHEEIVWHGRPMKSGEKASENVNECSFMWRIVFYPFNGPILCHMIESKQPAKTRHRLHACIPPADIYALKRSRPSGQKLGREKLVREHFMAKILFLHQISCRVNQRTQLSLNRNLSDELCLAGEELSKAAMVSHLFRKTRFEPDFQPF